jgi:hypothetical protein
MVIWVKNGLSNFEKENTLKRGILQMKSSTVGKLRTDDEELFLSFIVFN